MAGHSRSDEPKINCGMPTGRMGQGPTCIQKRLLSVNCAVESHKRTLDELERIAVEYCDLHDIPLPNAFSHLEGDRDAKRLEWLAAYKLLGCTNATEAARNIGVPNPSQYGSLARKKLKTEILAWYSENAMGAEEVVSRLAAIARGEEPSKIVDDGEDRSEMFDRLDALKIIVKVHGLEKNNINVTNWTDEELLAHMEKMRGTKTGADIP